jgi:hypothetical protein
MTEYDKRHGGPYDRGSADSYYRRPCAPHYYVANTFTSAMVPKSKMTPDEIEAYMAGFEDNESNRNFKDWR